MPCAGTWPDQKALLPRLRSNGCAGGLLPGALFHIEDRLKKRVGVRAWSMKTILAAADRRKFTAQRSAQQLLEALGHARGKLVGARAQRKVGGTLVLVRSVPVSSLRAASPYRLVEAVGEDKVKH